MGDLIRAAFADDSPMLHSEIRALAKTCQRLDLELMFMPKTGRRASRDPLLRGLGSSRRQSA